MRTLATSSWLNSSSDNPHSDPGSEPVGDITSKIGAIILKHFENEEKLFTAIPMPDDEKAAHIRAHDEILDQYTQPQLDQMSGKLLDRAPTISLIQQWLLDHLTTHDLKIREYVASSPTGQVETNDR